MGGNFCWVTFPLAGAAFPFPLVWLLLLFWSWLLPLPLPLLWLLARSRFVVSCSERRFSLLTEWRPDDGWGLDLKHYKYYNWPVKLLKNYIQLSKNKILHLNLCNGEVGARLVCLVKSSNFKFKLTQGASHGKGIIPLQQQITLLLAQQ